MTRDPILTAPTLWLILRQGLPMAIGMGCHALFNLVDLLLVGKLGGDAVAGVHVATTINFLPMIAGNAVSVAAMAMMSQRLGAGDRDGAAAVSNWTLWLMLGLGTVLGILGAALAVPCVDLQGVTGEPRAIGIDYLIVVSLGTVTMFGLMQSTATMRANGEAWMPALLLIGANVLNLIFDLILIFGWPAAGIPAMGAVGAAYASTAARLIGTIAGLWWLSRRSYGLRLRLRGISAPRGIGVKIVELGVPNAVQMFVRAALVIALTRIAAEVGGPAAIVALGVTTRLDTVVLFASIGFASAATAVVGRNVGAQLAMRARRACFWAGVSALVFGALLLAGYAYYAEELIAAFVTDPSPAVIAAGVSYLRIAGIAQPLSAFCVAVTGGVNGAGRMVSPMVLDLLGYGALISIAWATLWWRAAPLSLAPVWWSYVWINAGLLLVYWVYLQRTDWRHSATLTA